LSLPRIARRKTESEAKRERSGTGYLEAAGDKFGVSGQGCVGAGKRRDPRRVGGDGSGAARGAGDGEGAGAAAQLQNALAA
jgi:hypothetical protein